jgi:hypothetical protein
VISHTDYKKREDFDAALHDALIAAGVEIVCLAGFMRILTCMFSIGARVFVYFYLFFFYPPTADRFLSFVVRYQISQAVEPVFSFHFSNILKSFFVVFLLLASRWKLVCVYLILNQKKKKNQIKSNHTLLSQIEKLQT